MNDPRRCTRVLRPPISADSISRGLGISLGFLLSSACLPETTSLSTSQGTSESGGADPSSESGGSEETGESSETSGSDATSETSGTGEGSETHATEGPSDACEGVDCSAHGDCEEVEGDPMCVCDVGFSGANCESCEDGYHYDDLNDSCRPFGHLQPVELPGTLEPGAQPPPTAFQQDFNPTDNPIGGGPGYAPIFTVGDYIVTTKAELVEALATATRGETIFIPGHVEIDLSSTQLDVPGGVTIASDRGRLRSQGALLYSDTVYIQQSPYVEDYLFRATGPGVTFTGLRLRGPDSEIGEPNDETANAIKGMAGFLEVSNCELYHWKKWGIDLVEAHGDFIHHNFIHHTRRHGYGYGVWLRGKADDTPPTPDEIPRIEANHLEHCRHEIGSGGQDSSSYVARHNLTLEHSMPNHVYDRHSDGYYTEVAYNVLGWAWIPAFLGHGRARPRPVRVQPQLATARGHRRRMARS